VPRVDSPTVRRRELGALLRQYRNEAGLAVKDVTDRLLCSAAKISRIETGQRSATPRDVRDLCDMYGVNDPAVRDRLMGLARESRQQGWWQRYDLDSPLQTYVGLEAASSHINDYESSTVPGLLQTHDYANAMLRVWQPEKSPEQRKQAIEARLIRQRLLDTDGGPRLWTVMDEAVLHRRVGGTDVMRTQLEHILKASEATAVTVQVLPFRAGAHRGMDSTFVLLDFDEPAVSSIVYVEGMVGQLYLEQPADVARYRRAFDELRAVALSPADSAQLIVDVAREM